RSIVTRQHFTIASPRPTVSPMARRRAFIIIYACSGAAGLIYEIVWTRLLTLELGHTTAAAGTVLAAFMGGLAFGALVGGQLASCGRPVCRQHGRRGGGRPRRRVRPRSRDRTACDDDRRRRAQCDCGGRRMARRHSPGAARCCADTSAKSRTGAAVVHAPAS